MSGTRKDVLESRSNVEELEAAISSPDFSHVRAGAGPWSERLWIFHRDARSIPGVRLVAAGDASVVAPILRRLRGISPLSLSDW